MKPTHLLTDAPYNYKASYADACTRVTEAEHAAEAAADDMDETAFAAADRDCRRQQARAAAILAEMRNNTGADA